tara:strand:+ start:348 stop:680 length:333 start_codon:yes stop_codon:yes gene_type:complete
MSQENVAADNDGGRKRIPVEDFVSAWLDTHRDGGHIGDVAEKLGLAEGSVSVRASTLKKKLNEEFGVALPKLARRASTRQKQDLTAVAERLQQYAAAIPAEESDEEMGEE